MDILISISIQDYSTNLSYATKNTKYQHFIMLGYTNFRKYI